MSEISKLLQDPFDAQDVEWRVQQGGISGGGKPWVKVIPYITSRAVQQRLDDVFGPFGWKIEQRETNDGSGYICAISVFDPESKQWITKQDGSEKTKIEPLKGGVSGAMKRAAVQWGIGRYLYNMDEAWADCTLVENRWDCLGNCHVVKGKNGTKDRYISWIAPLLPSWALPQASADRFRDAISACDDLDDLKSVYTDAYKFAKSFNRGDLVNEFSKLKDEAKEKIQEKLIALSDESRAEISAWLEKQVAALVTLQNESSFKQLKTRLIEELTSKCKSKCVDSKEMLDHVKSINWSDKK